MRLSHRTNEWTELKYVFPDSEILFSNSLVCASQKNIMPFKLFSMLLHSFQLKNWVVSILQICVFYVNFTLKKKNTEL